MCALSLSKLEVARVLKQKLNLQFRKGKEANGWFELDGRKILRVTVPKGRGDLAFGTARSIRDQLKLSNSQFADLANCPLSGKDYEEIIRGKVAQAIL